MFNLKFVKKEVTLEYLKEIEKAKKQCFIKK